MEFAGSFRQFSFLDVMRSIEEGQRTGRLDISNGGLQASIYFANGQWLLVERSGPGQILAQQFVKARIIRPEQIEALSGVPFDQAGQLPDLHLVRQLMSAGALTQEQLRAWAMNDAVALLAVVLTWEDGEYRFENGAGIPQGRVALPMPVGPLIEQALRHLQDSGVPVGPPPREAVPLPGDAVVDFVEIDPAEDGAIRLTREQWRFLTAVDGESPLRHLAAMLQMPESAVLGIAGELVAEGIVVVVGYITSGAR